ncbi:MAG: sodium:solute symporter family transporter [Planctomycetota bacterium]
MNIQILDLVVIIAFFIATISIGLWFSRKSGENKESFFLAGRSLTWPLIGASMFATNISAQQFVGQGGLAFSVGIGASIWQLTGVFGIFLLGMLYLPRFLHMRLYTLPQFLEDRYGRGVRVFTSAYSIILILMTALCGSLYAGALVLQKLVGMDSVLSFYVFMLLLGVITTIYTFLGGLKAVVITDFVQNFILILGGICTLGFGLYYASKMPDGLAGLWGLKEVAANGDVFSKWSMYRPADHSAIPTLGIILGGIITAQGVHCFSHEYVQRGLGAKSIYHAKMGTLLGCCFKVLAIFIIGAPGVIAAYLLQDQGVMPDQSFVALVIKVLPVGVSGLVLAGLIAAIMSTIDSDLCACSSLYTIDFYLRKHPEASEKKTVMVGRIFMIGLIIVAMLWTPLITSFKHLFQYIQAMTSYIVPPIVVVYIAGLYYRRSNNPAALATLIFGILAGMASFCMSNLKTFAEGTFSNAPWLRDSLLAAHNFLPGWLTGLHFLYSCFALFILCAVIMVVVSHLTPPPSPEQRDAAKLHDYGVFKTESVHAKRKVTIMVVVLTIITAVTIWAVA